MNIVRALTTYYLYNNFTIPANHNVTVCVHGDTKNTVSGLDENGCKFVTVDNTENVDIHVAYFLSAIPYYTYFFAWFVIILWLLKLNIMYVLSVWVTSESKTNHKISRKMNFRRPFRLPLRYLIRKNNDRCSATTQLSTKNENPIKNPRTLTTEPNKSKGTPYTPPIESAENIVALTSLFVGLAYIISVSNLK